MADCLFCKIINGAIPAEFIYEDDHMVVFKDKFPKAKVHLLAVPKVHIDSLKTLDVSQEPLMGHMIGKLATIAAMNGLEEGFKTAIHTGAKGGQEIFHLHIHILGG